MPIKVPLDAVPAQYREIEADIKAAVSAEFSKKDILRSFLKKSKLRDEKLEQIWELLQLSEDDVTSEQVFAALALVAWAQQGRELSHHLFDSQTSGLPSVYLGPSSRLRYCDLVRIDTIDIELVPEKKGLFIKHVEYLVSSKRFDSRVNRRYNDFIALYEVLLNRFPYRLIPKLPPKRMIVGASASMLLGAADTQFIEERRRSLTRWLTLVARHPTISTDPILHYFLTAPVDDLQFKIRETFRRMPDEFATSEFAVAKELVPADSTSEFATSREQIRVILQGVSRIKQIAENFATRSYAYADDVGELASQLNKLAVEPGGNSEWATGGNSTWTNMKRGFSLISREMSVMSGKASSLAQCEETEVCERLRSLSDVLAGHADLCERVEKGVASDHQKALSKMLALKRRQMQGVLRGSDAESVETLERRMLAQESMIASVEQRAAFSLHCVHMETQLVHAQLEVLAGVLNTLVDVQANGHAQLAGIWRAIHPTVSKCLPENQRSS
ncbi:sorting nexin-8-like [Macrosteles quadrilineatus]|uniref:sorting nexin-8-like n=1 Tax=Macrosteles quadrilineatus TaxID=74068 RepID=UPI0023E161F2|nr:sorting nexin-8-like [Macrosteles quadrilineatus]